MRWLGAILLSLWLTCTAQSAFVQGTSGTATASPVSLTFGAAIGSGNCVWGIISSDGNVTETIGGSIGGVSFTQIDQVIDGVNSEVSTTFVAGNITSGPTTASVTITGSNGAHFTAIAVEESNCFAAANPVDGTAHIGTLLSTATTNPASGNITTATANDTIVGAVLNDGGTTTFTAGSGFTLRTTALLNAAFPMATEDSKTLVTPGTTNSSFGNTQSTEYSIFAIALKPAATATCGKLPLLGAGC